MSICCDDSASCEESRGKENFFAIKKVYEGSFDGETWYKAGDIVYYGDGKKRMLKSVILEVEFDGSILVENEKGIFSCSVQEMKSGHMALGKPYDSDHDGVFAVRYREQFTIDLSNWFSVDQICIIATDILTYVGAKISNVMPNGNIHISLDGEEEIVHYSEIREIKDFYENTSYLFMKTRTKLKAPVIVEKHFTTRMKDCS